MGDVVGDVEVDGIAVTLPGGVGVAPSPLGPGAGLCPASPPDGGAGLGASLHAKRAMKSTLMDHLDIRRGYHGRRDPPGRDPTDVDAKRSKLRKERERSQRPQVHDSGSPHFPEDMRPARGTGRLGTGRLGLTPELGRSRSTARSGDEVAGRTVDVCSAPFGTEGPAPRQKPTNFHNSGSDRTPMFMSDLLRPSALLSLVPCLALVSFVACSVETVGPKPDDLTDASAADAGPGDAGIVADATPAPSLLEEITAPNTWRVVVDEPGTTSDETYSDVDTRGGYSYFETAGPQSTSAESHFISVLFAKSANQFVITIAKGLVPRVGETFQASGAANILINKYGRDGNLGFSGTLLVDAWNPKTGVIAGRALGEWRAAGQKATVRMAFRLALPPTTTE